MKVITGDWLMNAGIVGYLRISEPIKKKPDLSKDFIEFTDPKDFDFFTESYFTTALMRLVRQKYQFPARIFTPIKTKIGNKEMVELRTKFNELGADYLRKVKVQYTTFDSTLEDILKQLEPFKNEALTLCDTELGGRYKVDEKNIAKIKTNLDQEISKHIERLNDRRLGFIYGYFKLFYQNKKVIAQSIKSNGDRKAAFQETYIEPVKKLLNHSKSTKSTEGFLCRFCKQNRVIPKEFFDTDSLFTEGMFSTIAVSTQKFKNFFYNMQPDLFICDLCELFLICAWAGFTEIPWRFRDKVNDRAKDMEYIFVNIPSLQLLWDENTEIKNLYEYSQEEVQGTPYQDIIQDIFIREREYKKKSHWVLSNILFIEIKTTPVKAEERPDLKYFHIGRDIAYLFRNEDAIKALKNIYGKIHTGNNKEVSVRRDVVRRILNYESMFPLCSALLTGYLKERHDNYLGNTFNILVISSVRGSIISTFQNRGINMSLGSAEIQKILLDLQGCGRLFNYLEYEIRRNKSYVLLSLIRSGRAEDFYDILMKIYMGEKKPIPRLLMDLLNEEDQIGFQARAYAFMSGFLG